MNGKAFKHAVYVMHFLFLWIAPFALVDNEFKHVHWWDGHCVNSETKRLPRPVPVPNFSSSPALLLPNHDEPPTTAETQRNLMWLSTTYSSAQKCQYPLPRCVYYMCLRGEEIQKVSNCDYSLVWFWTQALRLGDSLTETETWKSLRKLE